MLPLVSVMVLEPAFALSEPPQVVKGGAAAITKLSGASPMVANESVTVRLDNAEGFVLATLIVRVEEP